jgi:hypothetical protein
MIENILCSLYGGLIYFFIFLFYAPNNSSANK